jgi:drug/metabolite transporter (DMT)-like permease
LRFTRLDALLLLMTVIWGTNYTVIKSAFKEIEPHAFNALRLIIASSEDGGIRRTSSTPRSR